MIVYLNTETVAGGAMTKTVTHNLANANAIVARTLASWLTSISITGRTANEVSLAFSDEAPAGGGELDIRILS